MRLSSLSHGSDKGVLTEILRGNWLEARNSLALRHFLGAIAIRVDDAPGRFGIGDWRPSCAPVLASRVTSGQTRLTVLIGTTTLQGSMESDAFAEPRSGTIKSSMSKVRNRHVARLCVGVTGKTVAR